MYELKRAPRIKEQLKIGDEVIDVDIDVENTAVEFNKCRNAVIAAEQDIKKMRESGEESTAVLEKYGKAITELLVTIFGVDNTQKIVDFYEGRYIELTTEVFPFVINVIGPKMKSGIEDMRERAASLYKSSQAAKLGLNRATRRKYGIK